MRKWFESRALWGVLLIIGGVALLLQNLVKLHIGDLFWAVILGLGGAAFISYYLENRVHWWALIPGITLLSVAVAALTSYLPTRIGEALGGLVVLGGIGFSFVLIYLVNRDFWWAVIPAGVLITLGVVSVLDSGGFGIDTGGIFFVGIGLTFLVVALLPGYRDQLKWAYFPALATLIVGSIIMATSSQMFGFVWPAIVIVIGGVMIWLAIIAGRS